MKKVYVIKNVKTKKYSTRRSWTNNLFKADKFDQGWVNKTNEYTKNGDKDSGLSKNEKFVAVIMKEA